ncbi:MAG: VTT domain-containing protein [Methylophaga sp.]|nr:VTT domain-containing protein [Methylophaga sp.]
MSADKIIQPGKNCWQTARAQRAKLLIDGENYFPAIHQAIQNARHDVLILAWDIDSRMRLTRGDDPNQQPQEFGHLLCKMLEEKPELNVYILNWDWAMLYTFEREWLPTYRPLWRNQQRLHYELDGECPATASQHQKVVVIDNQIAFCGGFDLGKHRWDSREHLPDDSRRIDPDKQIYPPFHDIDWLVDGKAAEALGELARQRWQRATGQQLAVAENPADCWPQDITPDFTDIDIAIARTQPAFREWPQIREVEQLYLDSIKSAENLIYIENQYFSSHSVTKALVERLAEKDGPDVVMVLPKKTGGWLEQQTMDVLRARLMRQLLAADEHQRLRVCFPYREALGDGYISVHSKMMVIDDRLLRVGSSNLSNRSMGLDSECDLAFEAQTAAQQQEIAAFRHDLLAEHFGLSQQALVSALKSAGSLRKLIDIRANEAHTLKQLDCKVAELSDELLPDASVIDPEKPLEAEDMASLLVPLQQRKAFRKQWLMSAGVLLFVVLLTAIWRFTPLGEWLNEDNLRSAASMIEQQPLAPLMIVLVFAICSLLAVPVSLLIIATVVTFGPWTGSAYAMGGSILGGLLGFWLGHLLGRGGVSRLAGARINRLSRRLGEQGLLAVITVRIVPVAPFTVINMVAGASHIRFRDFLWGTVLGMLPGIIAFSAFADSLIATLKQPQPQQLAILAGVVMAIIAMTLALKKFFAAKSAKVK